MPAIARESLEVMETLAAFDPESFAFMVEHTTGIRATARRDLDPIYKEAIPEDIDAVASIMVDEDAQRLDDYDHSVKEIGESYGYVMALA